MFSLSRICVVRRFSSKTHVKTDFINWEYFDNPQNLPLIIENVSSRKVSCDLINVVNCLKEFHKCVGIEKEKMKTMLTPLLKWYPNDIHPEVIKNKSQQPIEVKKIGRKPGFTYFPSNFETVTKRLNILRTRYLGHMSGNKSYYLKGDLALLERALARLAVAKLMKKNFQLISVPDIIPKSSLEGCGMRTDGQHSQVYFTDDDWAEDMCLSGTAEIAIASFLSGKVFNNACLPLKFCAVSRCYRAEAKKHQTEKGIFRVHQFTKVEMFGITSNETGEESENLLKEFTEIQEEIFSELGLYCRIIEMPPCDMGLPAYHKFDMEAWIPTQKLFGEISSASNCTDFQSRRLNIKYVSSSNEEKYCHTVNGTACAVPRLLITIFENFQNLDGSINIPTPLQAYFKKQVIKDKFIEKSLCTKRTK